MNRERGKSHYGIGRTFRVFFDLMTIRFLLKYMTRPLHFFGTVGMLGVSSGSLIALLLAALKIFDPHASLMEAHAPLFVVAAVLFISGIQLLALGLLGELQVRHYFTQQHPEPYAIDRIVRLIPTDEPQMLSGRHEENF